MITSCYACLGDISVFPIYVGMLEYKFILMLTSIVAMQCSIGEAWTLSIHSVLGSLEIDVNNQDTFSSIKYPMWGSELFSICWWFFDSGRFVCLFSYTPFFNRELALFFNQPHFTDLCKHLVANVDKTYGFCPLHRHFNSATFVHYIATAC